MSTCRIGRTSGSLGARGEGQVCVGSKKADSLVGVVCFGFFFPKE